MRIIKILKFLMKSVFAFFLMVAAVVG